MAAATTRLYLVRHGATRLTAEDRFSGAVGVELSEEGRHQVGRLAERLTPEAISAVYCSPLSRTVETAEILARPHRLTPERRDGLREISHGHWERLIRREVEALHPYETRPGSKTRSRSLPREASRSVARPLLEEVRREECALGVDGREGVAGAAGHQEAPPPSSGLRLTGRGVR